MKVINKTNPPAPVSEPVQAATAAPEQITPFSELKDLIGTASVVFTGIYSKELEVVPGYLVKFKTLSNADNLKMAEMVKVSESTTTAQYLEAAIVPTLTYAIDSIRVVDPAGDKVSTFNSDDPKIEDARRKELHAQLSSKVPQAFLNLLFSKYLDVVAEFRDIMQTGVKKK